MPSSKYPTDAQARKTFSDEEFETAVTERMDKTHYVEVVRFETYTNPELVLNSRILTRIADLIDDLPYECQLIGTSISRPEFRFEAEKQVLSNRKNEMQYNENSSHYMAHEKSDE